MISYIEFMKRYPHEVMKVIKENNYLSALDIKQLSNMGCPIMMLLVENNEKISGYEELCLLVRERKITFDDVNNAINKWGTETKNKQI